MRGISNKHRKQANLLIMKKKFQKKKKVFKKRKNIYFLLCLPINPPKTDKALTRIFPIQKRNPQQTGKYKEI